MDKRTHWESFCLGPIIVAASLFCTPGISWAAEPVPICGEGETLWVSAAGDAGYAPQGLSLEAQIHSPAFEVWSGDGQTLHIARLTDLPKTAGSASVYEVFSGGGMIGSYALDWPIADYSNLKLGNKTFQPGGARGGDYASDFFTNTLLDRNGQSVDIRSALSGADEIVYYANAKAKMLYVHLAMCSQQKKPPKQDPPKVPSPKVPSPKVTAPQPPRPIDPVLEPPRIERDIPDQSVSTDGLVSIKSGITPARAMRGNTPLEQGPETTFSAANLPPGLSVNPATGEISGQAELGNSSQTYAITLSAESRGKIISQSFKLTVPAKAITPPPSPSPSPSPPSPPNPSFAEKVAPKTHYDVRAGAGMALISAFDALMRLVLRPPVPAPMPAPAPFQLSLAGAGYGSRKRKDIDFKNFKLAQHGMAMDGSIMDHGPIDTEFTTIYRAVGRVGDQQIGEPTGREKSYGTAFLIAPNKVMTNYHVWYKYSDYFHDETGVEFEAVQESEATEFYRFNKEAPVKLPGLDIVIFTLERSVTGRKELYFSEVPATDLEDKDMIVVGYPVGRPLTMGSDVRAVITDKPPIFGTKRWSEGRFVRHSTDIDDYGVQRDVSDTVNSSGKLGAVCHNASTQPGNSGSPACCPNTGKVLAVHFSSGEDFADAEDVNLAIPSEDIIRAMGGRSFSNPTAPLAPNDRWSKTSPYENSSRQMEKKAEKQEGLKSRPKVRPSIRERLARLFRQK